MQSGLYVFLISNSGLGHLSLAAKKQFTGSAHICETVWRFSTSLIYPPITSLIDIVKTHCLWNNQIIVARSSLGKSGRFLILITLTLSPSISSVNSTVTPGLSVASKSVFVRTALLVEETYRLLVLFRLFLFFYSPSCNSPCVFAPSLKPCYLAAQSYPRETVRSWKQPLLCLSCLFLTFSYLWPLQNGIPDSVLPGPTHVPPSSITLDLLYCIYADLLHFALHEHRPSEHSSPQRCDCRTSHMGPSLPLFRPSWPEEETAYLTAHVIKNPQNTVTAVPAVNQHPASLKPITYLSWALTVLLFYILRPPLSQNPRLTTWCETLPSFHWNLTRRVCLPTSCLSKTSPSFCCSP